MTVTIAQFWSLLAQSRLVSRRRLDTCRREFTQRHGEDAGVPPREAAEWLIARKQLSRFQAAVLLSGRAGPFFYGPYRVHGYVESGRLQGFFRAVHEPTRHPVMLQFLRREQLPDFTAWRALIERVGRLAPLDEPHVVHYHAAVEVEGFKFLVLDDLRGKSLRQRLDEAQPLAAERACRVAVEAARGLAALHRLGLVHGALRPDHLWLQKTAGQPSFCQVFLDLLAPPAPASGQPAPDEADYLAPELGCAMQPPDARSDLYALGCTLYEMLAGKPPFAGGTVAEKIQRHAGQPIQPLDELGVPPAVAQLVAYLMAKNPAVRYQDAAEVAEQLAHYAGVQSPVPLAWPPPTLAEFRRHVTPAAPAAEATAPDTPAADFPPPTPTNPATSTPATATPATATPATSTPATAATTAAVTPHGRPAGDAAGQAAAAGTAAQPLPLGAEAAPAVDRWKRRRRRRSWLPWAVTGAAGLVALLALAGAAWMAQRPAGPASRPAAADPAPPSAPAAAERAAAAVVADDGRLLWASPTEAPPLPLNYLPPGIQLLVAARPAELLASHEGARVVQALGAGFQRLCADWEQAAGVELDDVQLMLIGVHDQPGASPRTSFVVYLAQPAEVDELRRRWGNPAPVTEGDVTYYASSSWSYLVPQPEEGVRRPSFVMAAPEEMADVVRFQGAPPPLRREFEMLHEVSDRQRHVTVVVAPHYLETDGRRLLDVYDGRLRDGIDWLLGDGVRAAMGSMHIGEQFYVEARLVTALDQSPQTVADRLAARIRQLPERVEEYLVQFTPHPYWRPIAVRFPQMVRFVESQTRVQVEQNQVVANSVAPGIAAHNLALGAELALAGLSGESVAAAAAAVSRPASPQTLDELLEAPVSIAFDQQSLEFALRDLADEVVEIHPGLPFPFKIMILGDDLQLEGITRNQQIRDFRQQDQTVGQVLTALVMRANPVTTVRQPSDPDQRLVWVAGPDPDNPDQPIVLITTRDAASRRGYELPGPFHNGRS